MERVGRGYLPGVFKNPVAPSDSVFRILAVICLDVIIDGDVDYSILFSNVTVEEGAKVRYSIIMPGTTIKAGAVVEYSIVAENAVIDEGAVVGESPEACENLDNWGVTVIGEKVTIGKKAFVKAKEMIDTDVKEAE